MTIAPTLTLADAARMMREAMRDKKYRSTPIGGEIGRFLRHTRNEDWSPRSRAEYESSLYRMALHFADLELRDLEPPVGVERLDEFIDQTWGHLARGTRAKNISILKSFFGWAMERGRIHGDPMMAIKRPRRRRAISPRRAHNRSEVLAIVAAQHHLRDRIAILLMAKLGLRKDELRQLRIMDVHLADDVLVIHQKGGDVVEHPIEFPDVRGLLEQHIVMDGRQPREYLLHPRWERTINGARTVIKEAKDRPMSPRGVHEWWAKRLAEAEVGHFPMHELRHTAGTEYYKATLDMKRTQQFMRHQSMTTTADTYTHLDRADLRNGMKRAAARWAGSDEAAD